MGTPIREYDGATSPQMLALAINWHMRTNCYVQGCDNPLSTIVPNDENGPYALCEEHFKAASVPGGITLTIEF